MTDAYPTRRALRELGSEGRRNRRGLRRVAPWQWMLIGVGTLLLVLVGWIGVRGLMAKAALESAIPLVSDIKDDLKSVQLASAQGTVTIVAEKTDSARQLTSDPIWRAAELVPLLGPNLTAFRELADITDDIVGTVMVPVAGLGDTLDPSSLKPVDGRIDVAPFVDASPVIHGARDSFDSSFARASALDTSGAIGPIQDAHAQLVDMLEPLVPLMTQADALVAQLPTFLGAEGPRNYLLVFQNNSEARALGGHAGSWVLINVDDGKIVLQRQATVHELKTGDTAVIALPAEQLGLWPGAAIDPSNVTMVPHLELSAETAAAFWVNRFGPAPDAVVFMDPVALGYILAATGPIELPTGDIIDAENAAEFLLNGVYLKYPLNADQDVVFGSLAKAVFGAITGGGFDPKKLVDAVMDAGQEHRILTWFFDEAEQAAFAGMPFDLSEPALTDDAAGFGLYITDNLGSKMTYYVNSKVELGQAQCASGEVQYQVKPHSPTL